jgi:hypothetical protein
MAEARQAEKSVLHAALLCLFIRFCLFGGASGTRIRVVYCDNNATCVSLKGVKITSLKPKQQRVRLYTKQ